MPTAPHRGQRKCRTCVLYTDIQDQLRGGCQLSNCECAAANVKAGKTENWGISSCKHHKGPTYLDSSNHGDIGGPITGYCEWKSPPILRKLLWDQFQYRAVNADASWCHCWQPAAGGGEIKTTIMIAALPIERAIEYASETQKPAVTNQGEAG